RLSEEGATARAISEIAELGEVCAVLDRTAIALASGVGRRRLSREPEDRDACACHRDPRARKEEDRTRSAGPIDIRGDRDHARRARLDQDVRSVARTPVAVFDDEAPLPRANADD